MLDKADLGLLSSPIPPWYRQFWPWFLIALPATVVVAGFFTLYLAIKYSDDLVSDNYYRDGLAINQQLSQDLHATELGLSAMLDFDAASGDAIEILDLQLHSSRLNSGSESFIAPATLTLRLLHPTDAKADHSVQLISAGGGRYRAQLPPLPAQRFYLRVISNDSSGQADLQNDTWRLTGEINFKTSQRIQLQAAPAAKASTSPKTSSTQTLKSTVFSGGGASPAGPTIDDDAR